MKKVDFELVEDIIKISGIAKLISDNGAGTPLVVSSVPGEWREQFHSYGFTDYAQYHAY